MENQNVKDKTIKQKTAEKNKFYLTLGMMQPFFLLRLRDKWKTLEKCEKLKMINLCKIF